MPLIWSATLRGGNRPKKFSSLLVFRFLSQPPKHGLCSSEVSKETQTHSICCAFSYIFFLLGSEIWPPPPLRVVVVPLLPQLPPLLSCQAKVHFVLVCATSFLSSLPLLAIPPPKKKQQMSFLQRSDLAFLCILRLSYVQTLQSWKPKAYDQRRGLHLIPLSLLLF